jgi:hypothetical protein
MCEKVVSSYCIPSECYESHGSKRGHRICSKLATDCWWSKFAQEGESHKCPGCEKAQKNPKWQVPPDPHKGRVIDLTMETT